MYLLNDNDLNFYSIIMQFNHDDYLFSFLK